MKFSWKATFVAILFQSAFTGLCSAERITLINDDVIEGQVIAQDDRTITIKTVNQTFALPRARIKSVEKGVPGSQFLMQANEMIKRGDYKGARDQVDQAKAAGATAKDTLAITELLDKRQAEIELAKYADLFKEARTAAQQGEDNEAMHKVAELMKALPADSPARKEIISILCDYHMTRVAEHRDKVRNEMAIEELSHVIDLDPNRAMAYAELADIYSGSSTSWNEALKNYDASLKLNDPKLDANARARIFWQEGEILRQQSKFQEAAEKYLEAYKINPSVNTRLSDQIVDVSRRAAEPLVGTDNEQALKIVDAGLAVRETTELLLQRGNLLRRLMRYDESNAAYERVAEKNPRTKNLFFSMAQNDFSKGEILTGRDLLMKEIEFFPTNYEALCQLGDYCLQRDDYEGAENNFAKAVNIDPDKPRASLGLGRAYRQKAELDKAREAVQAVLDRLPDNREANLEMGRILRDENNLDEATKFFTEVLDLIDRADAKDKDELKELKADALIARGELSLLTTGPGTASIDFRKALEVLPEYSQAFYSIGMAYRKKFASSKRIEDLKIAEENLLTARRLGAENAQFALELGILYQQQMAQADAPNEKNYLAKATENYRDYIKLGGANAPQVQAWIRDIETK